MKFKFFTNFLFTLFSHNGKIEIWKYALVCLSSQKHTQFWIHWEQIIYKKNVNVHHFAPCLFGIYNKPQTSKSTYFNLIQISPQDHNILISDNVVGENKIFLQATITIYCNKIYLGDSVAKLLTLWFDDLDKSVSHLLFAVQHRSYQFCLLIVAIMK